MKSQANVPEPSPESPPPMPRPAFNCPGTTRLLQWLGVQLWFEAPAQHSRLILSLDTVHEKAQTSPYQARRAG